MKKVLFVYFNLSKFGYYKWLWEKNISGRYDKELLSQVFFVHKKYNNNYGALRIQVTIEREIGKKWNIENIRRYINKLEIKSEARINRVKYGHNKQTYKKFQI